MTSTSRDNHFLPAHIGLTKHVDTKTHDTSTDALLATLEISLLGVGNLGCTATRSKDTQRLKKWIELGAELRRRGLKQGFGDKQILRLLNTIVHPHFDSTLAHALIEALYPNDRVPLRAFTKILSFVGNPSITSARIAIKIALLQWLVQVFHLLDDTDRRSLASSYYGAMFHHIECEHFQRSICYLLCNLTSAYHVKQYRVEKLCAIYKSSPNPEYVGSLFSIYQKLCPQLLPFTFWKVTPLPALTNVRWRTKLNAVRRKRVACERGMPVILQRDTGGLRHMEECMGKTCVLGAECPRQQIIAGSRDMTLVESINGRLATYLRMPDGSYLAEEELGVCLKRLLQFTRSSRNLPKITQEVLFNYLVVWDGRQHMREVFELLSYIQPTSSEDFFKRVLRPLLRLYATADVEWKASLINSGIDLLITWAQLDWSLLRPSRPILNQSLAPLTGPAQMEERRLMYRGVIEVLDKMAVLGLIMEHDHVCLQHAALRFCEVIPDLVKKLKVPSMPLPSNALVYRFFFAGSAMPVSRLCSIIADYKEAYEMVDNANTDDSVYLCDYDKEEVAELNSYLIDVIDALWRGRAFAGRDRNARNFHVSRELLSFVQTICAKQGSYPSRYFTLAVSPVLSLYACDFTRICEDVLGVKMNHADIPNVNERQSKENQILSHRDWKIYLLDYLKERGFTGLYYFFYTSLQSLIKRHESLGKLSS